MTRAASIRMQVEIALEGRIPAALSQRSQAKSSTLMVAPAELKALTGGIPRGALTEIAGPASSGRTAVLHSLLAAATQAQEFCALIDASDSFDPRSASEAGVLAEQLLWIRCPCGHGLERLEKALKSADMLLQSGGWGVVALDLADLPAAVVRKVPLTSWFRLRRAVEHTRTALVVVVQEFSAGASASLALKFSPQPPDWLGGRAKLELAAHTAPLRALRTAVEVSQDRAYRKPPQSTELSFESGCAIG